MHQADTYPPGLVLDPVAVFGMPVFKPEGNDILQLLRELL